jgi:hypothetical protein
MQNELNLMS